MTGLSPSLLELEVTEDILLRDEQGVLDTFLRIQELGVRVVPGADAERLFHGAGHCPLLS